MGTIGGLVVPLVVAGAIGFVVGWFFARAGRGPDGAAQGRSDADGAGPGSDDPDDWDDWAGPGVGTRPPAGTGVGAVSTIALSSSDRVSNAPMSTATKTAKIARANPSLPGPLRRPRRTGAPVRSATVFRRRSSRCRPSSLSPS